MSRIPRRALVPSALLILILLLPIFAAAGVAFGAPADGRQRAAAPAFLLQWGSKGTGNGQFDRPNFIAVDDNGFVYVADQGNHRIQKFDEDGVYVGQWGRYGTGDADFSSPRGIAVSPGTDADPTQYVYVVDSSNDRIQKFTPGRRLRHQVGQARLRQRGVPYAERYRGRAVRQRLRRRLGLQAHPEVRPLRLFHHHVGKPWQWRRAVSKPPGHRRRQSRARLRGRCTATRAASKCSRRAASFSTSGPASGPAATLHSPPSASLSTWATMPTSSTSARGVV